MSVKRALRPLLAAIIIAAPGAALAQMASCLVQAEPIEFDRYDVFDPQPLRATTQVRLSCNRPVAAAVALSPGSSGDYSRRSMLGADALLTYNLYADPGGSYVAGDGSNGTVLLVQRRRSLSRSQTFFIYGEVDPRQMVTPGDYSDIVHVTVEF